MKIISLLKIVLFSIGLCFLIPTFAQSANQKNVFVFSGGGVKGIAYLGALQAYKEITGNNISDIKSVVGASAGSITALLIASGMSIDDIKTVLWSINFSDFEDGANKIIDTTCLLTAFGWYRGEVLYQFLRQILKQRGINPDISLKALASYSPEINLTVFTTNLSTSSSKALSNIDIKSQNISAAYAVRTSASLPLFFDAMFYQQTSDGYLSEAPSSPPCTFSNSQNITAFIDGGVMNNYPIEYAFKSEPIADGSNVLGFILLSKNQVEWLKGSEKTIQKSYEVHPYALKSYAFSLINSLSIAQYRQFINNSKVLNNTVMIDDLNIPTTKFSLTDSEKKSLIRSGYCAAYNYYNKTCPAQSEDPTLLDAPDKTKLLYKVWSTTSAKVKEKYQQQEQQTEESINNQEQ